MKGKQTVAPFPNRSRSKTSRVLELGHTNVMGPMKTPSKGGAKYVLTFVDDYSRYVVAYLLKKKSEVAAKLNAFMKFYEKQWGGTPHVSSIGKWNGVREQGGHADLHPERCHAPAYRPV
jgi:hypothetical protein